MCLSIASLSSTHSEVCVASCMCLSSVGCRDVVEEEGIVTFSHTRLRPAGPTHTTHNWRRKGRRWAAQPRARSGARDTHAGVSAPLNTRARWASVSAPGARDTHAGGTTGSPIQKVLPHTPLFIAFARVRPSGHSFRHSAPSLAPTPNPATQISSPPERH